MIQDQDLYDSWIEFWSMFFHVLDRYSATLAARVGLEAFTTKGLTEDVRLRFLDDLLHFLTQLRDQEETDIRLRASKCYDIFSARLTEAVSTCVKADYEAEGSGQSDAHFDELLTALTAQCLQSGPKLLGKPEGEEILDAPPLNTEVTEENVEWKTDGAVLKGLLTSYEIVRDYQQHPMDPVVKPNIADMFEKVYYR